MTDIPIQQEGESDEAYQKRIAASVEKELVVKPMRRDQVALVQNQQKLRDDAIERYNSNPKTCVVCGDLIPYDRRYLFTCSPECERDNVTEEQYNASPKHCFKCGDVIPYATRRQNICNKCRTNNIKDAYEANPKLCKKCGKPIPYENKDGFYCSKECMYQDQATMRNELNAKSHQEAVDRYMANPHYCKRCGAIVPYERRRGYYCSSECVNNTMTDEERKEKDRQRYQNYIQQPGVKERKAAYMKIYRQTPEFKERKREQDRRHYQENKEAISAKRKAKQSETYEKRKEYFAKYNIDHKDQIRERKAKKYAENKLGEAICSFCGDVYHITNTSTTLCQKCLKQAYENEKNDSQYATPDRLEHRRKMLEWGLITQEQFDNPDIVVHHVDGIRDHDVKDNLIAITRGDHTKIHNYHRKLIKQCAEKGTTPPSVAEVTKSAIEQFNIKILSKGE